MTSSNKKLRIAIDLWDENKAKFLKIKEYVGITSHTDVFRFLISEFYRRKIQNSQSSKE